MLIEVDPGAAQAKATVLASRRGCRNGRPQQGCIGATEAAFAKAAPADGLVAKRMDALRATAFFGRKLRAISCEAPHDARIEVDAKWQLLSIICHLKS
jgi:hypothetical protein